LESGESAGYVWWGKKKLIQDNTREKGKGREKSTPKGREEKRPNPFTGLIERGIGGSGV